MVRVDGLNADMISKYFVDKLVKIDMIISTTLSSITEPTIPPPLPPTLFTSFSTVTLSEASHLILSLKKSSPVDVVPIFILKSCNSVFSVLLMKLANCSFAAGKFPNAFKTAQITPLLKKPTLDPTDPASYRPISNLRSLGKLLERLAQARLRPHIMASPGFSPLQSAYRPGYSTETAGLKIANDLFASTASSTPSLLVSLDLSAAFDCVLHHKLLSRLSDDFGVSGSSLIWLQSYLTSRLQYVMLDNSRSQCCALLNGVPQGSVLGPLLFTAYVSPISRLIQLYGLSHHAYADDTTIFIGFDDKNLICKMLNDCTVALSSWFMFNGLILNPEKSDSMWVGSRSQLKTITNNQTDIKIAGVSISASNSLKIVGITFDSQLNFSEHISEICKVANFHLRGLSHIRRLLDVPTANMLACSIVGSRLDYCNSLLSGISEHNMNRLQRVQNRAAKIVMNAKGRVSCSAYLRELHWLPVRKRVDYKVALITFKYLTAHQPAYFDNILVPMLQVDH